MLSGTSELQQGATTAGEALLTANSTLALVTLRRAATSGSDRHHRTLRGFMWSTLVSVHIVMHHWVSCAVNLKDRSTQKMSHPHEDDGVKFYIAQKHLWSFTVKQRWRRWFNLFWLRVEGVSDAFSNLSWISGRYARGHFMLFFETSPHLLQFFSENAATLFFPWSSRNVLPTTKLLNDWIIFYFWVN